VIVPKAEPVLHGQGEPCSAAQRRADSPSSHSPCKIIAAAAACSNPEKTSLQQGTGRAGQSPLGGDDEPGVVAVGPEVALDHWILDLGGAANLGLSRPWRRLLAASDRLPPTSQARRSSGVDARMIEASRHRRRRDTRPDSRIDARSS